MDYELDSFGYVLHVYFGGSNEDATEYTGNVPSDYETLEEWAENAPINAYKIVDGNLYLDITKQAELEGVYSQEHEDNRYVTHKELEPFEDAIEVINNTLPYSTEATTQGVIAVTGSDTLAAPPSLLDISGFIPTNDDFDLIVNGTNLLPNTAVSQEISGLTFTQNQDRSITINGTGAGKNLFDYRTPDYSGGNAWEGYGNVSYALVDNGVVLEARYRAFAYELNNLIVGETYTFSFDAISNISVSVGVGLNVYNNSTANPKPTITINPTTTKNRYSFTFMAQSTNRIAINSGVNASLTNLTITDMQIEKGSTATTYEPYISSIEYNLAGSSTNTSPILLIKEHVMTGDPSYYLNNIGDNLLDISKLVNGYWYYNGTLTSNPNWSYVNQQIPVQPNTTYTISRDISSTTVSQFSIEEFDSNGNFVKHNAQWQAAGIHKYTITTQPTTAYIYCQWNNTYTYENIMFNEGSDRGKYIPLTMYNYDGTDRTEVYSGTGGVLEFTEDEPVTHITLSVPTFTEFNDFTIYPQMVLGTEEKPYETYKVRRYTIPMAGFVSTGYTDVLIQNGKAYAYHVGQTPIELGDVNVNLFSGANYIYTIQFSFIIARYYINNVALEGTSTENGGFSIDTNGNMTCNNATINNATIEGATINNATATNLTVDSGNAYFNGIGDEPIVSVNAVLTGDTLTTDGSSLSITQNYGEVDAEEWFNVDYGGIYHKGRNILENKILWSGGHYMTADHTAILSEKVSDQPHGIVLVWSAYASGSVQNYNWHFDFIPKEFVNLSSSRGFLSIMAGSKFNYVATKYVYISDDRITGNNDNSATGTGSGITYTNNAFVLRYVIGV